VNIRSGDKYTEAKPSKIERYIDEAEKIIIGQPLSFSRLLFITSDDLNAILEASAYAKSKNLQVIYSDVPRMKNGNQESQIDSFWNFNVTVSVLMQLSMTSECDAWIGSRSSNWNRIIDIYRCTRVNKCQQIFVEVGDTAHGHYDYNPFGGI